MFNPDTVPFLRSFNASPKQTSVGVEAAHVGLLSEKEVRFVAILCSLVLASVAINGLIIAFSSKGF